LRSVAQNVAYEIPILLSLLSIVLVTTSFNFKEIVEYQSGLLSFWMCQPVAFIIFLIAGCAETNRVPFDLPEAESELTAGYFTEYGGFSFGLFAMAEYGNLFIMSSVATIMFLGVLLQQSCFLEAGTAHLDWIFTLAQSWEYSGFY